MNTKAEFSPTPQLQPIEAGYRLRILTDEQLAAFKAATLEILEDVGVHCPSERALSIYADSGARVDMDTQIVKMPGDLVEKALSSAPRNYVMGARHAEYDVSLDGKHFYCATDGCGRVGYAELGSGPSRISSTLRPLALPRSRRSERRGACGRS